MEDFKQRVLEEQLFEELKDTSLRNSKYFKAKYEGAGVDFSRLYRRIINYQIKVYGGTLNDPTYVRRKYPEELIREHRNKRNRLYQKKGVKSSNNKVIE